MTEAKAPDQATAVRLLSLLLAGLLWLGVNLERPGELRLRVPVALGHLPAGLQLATAAPEALEVTVSGPRILLFGPWLRGMSCELDLSGAQAGSASYNSADCDLVLDRELKVVRVHPAALQLSFIKAAPASR
jgi:hypothetical protein